MKKSLFSFVMLFIILCFCGCNERAVTDTDEELKNIPLYEGDTDNTCTIDLSKYTKAYGMGGDIVDEELICDWPADGETNWKAHLDDAELGALSKVLSRYTWAEQANAYNGENTTSIIGISSETDSNKTELYELYANETALIQTFAPEGEVIYT